MGFCYLTRPEVHSLLGVRRRRYLLGTVRAAHALGLAACTPSVTATFSYPQKALSRPGLDWDRSCSSCCWSTTMYYTTHLPAPNTHSSLAPRLLSQGATSTKPSCPSTDSFSSSPSVSQKNHNRPYTHRAAVSFAGTSSHQRHLSRVLSVFFFLSLRQRLSSGFLCPLTIYLDHRGRTQTTADRSRLA